MAGDEPGRQHRRGGLHVRARPVEVGVGDAGGDAYLRYRQIELLPQIAPPIAEALAEAKLVTISGAGDGKGAAESATANITGVIQAVLAAQLVSRTGLLDGAVTSGNGQPTPAKPTANR